MREESGNQISYYPLHTAPSREGPGTVSKPSDSTLCVCVCVCVCVCFKQQTVIFISSSIGKESACNTGDPGSIPGLGRSPGEGIGYPLQYS